MILNTDKDMQTCINDMDNHLFLFYIHITVVMPNSSL